MNYIGTVRNHEIVPAFLRQAREILFFAFATQGCKHASFYLRQRNRVQARAARIRLPAGGLKFDSIESGPPARVSAQAPRLFVIYNSQLLNYFPLASSTLAETLHESI